MPRERLLGVVLNRAENSPIDQLTTTSIATTTRERRTVKDAEIETPEKTRRGGSNRQLRASRLKWTNGIADLAEAARGLRRDHRRRVPARWVKDAHYELMVEKAWLLKAALATFFVSPLSTFSIFTTFW
jgi:hypothetical protein